MGYPTRTLITTIIPSTTPRPVVSNTPLPTKTITPTSATTSDFKIILTTSPVSVGANATVRIQTVAGASCYLSYTTPSGTESQASELGATTAGVHGICSWTWNIGPKTKRSTGSLVITANDTDQFLDIVIQ